MEYEKYVSGEEDVDGQDDEDEDGDTDDSNEEFHSPALRLRRLALLIPLSEIVSSFPTVSLLSIITAATASLTHLHIAYAEPLLVHDTRVPRAITALPSLTHLVLSELGPKGFEALKAFSATLQHVEVDFDDGWVESVICALFAKPSTSSLVPAMPNGDSSGLPTPVLTQPRLPQRQARRSPLPDPVQLLVHSMSTLRTLRESNPITVTVADQPRYPSVRTLVLRLAGVPTVTPLVHAFPGVTEVHVYTPSTAAAYAPQSPSLLTLNRRAPPHP